MSNSTLETQSNERYYRTCDVYLASYLYAHGFWLVNVEPNEVGLPQFVFRNSAERDIFVHEFRHGPEALVDVRAFITALVALQKWADEVAAGLQ